MFLKHTSQSLLLRNRYLNIQNSRLVSCDRWGTMEKRARMLNKLIQNRDKTKHWHMVFASEVNPEVNPQVNPKTILKKKNVFEKIYKPARRMNVLNSLFFRNITDVMSTADVLPDLVGYGIEIVDVKITTDYRTVNVYWQLPPSKQSELKKIEDSLVQAAPKIRSELISRNVMGKVPYIFFIRDTENFSTLQFQENLKLLNSQHKDDSDEAPLISLEDIDKNLFKFRFSKKNTRCKKEKDEKEIPKSVEEPSCIPEVPADMKLNVYGLDYEKIMQKVVASKKESNNCSSEAAANQHISGENQNPFAAVGASPLRQTKTSEVMKFCKLRKLERMGVKKQNKSPHLDEYDPGEDLEIENFEDGFHNEEENDFFQKLPLDSPMEKL